MNLIAEGNGFTHFLLDILGYLKVVVFLWALLVQRQATVRPCDRFSH